MRVTWLPDVLRRAGLTVHEVSGWRSRGADSYGPLRGIICHATAGSRNSRDADEIRVLLNGSSSAPPPIAQLYLGRNGHFHVVASGLCYHALQGWGGPLKGYGNDSLLGIEAANDNRGQPWPAVQVDAYQRGVAAICRHMGWNPDRNVAAHREHQPGAKTDPHGIEMGRFRARVRALMEGEDDDMAGWTDDEKQSLMYLGEALRRGYTQIRTGPDAGKPVEIMRKLNALADSMNDPNLAIALFRLEALARGLDVVRAGPTKGEPVYMVQATKAIATALGQIDDAVAAQLADKLQRIEQAIAAFVAPAQPEG